MSESTSKSIDVGAAVANAPDSRDSVVATAPADSNPSITATAQTKTDPAFLHSPPDSNNTAKSDGSDSELSDLEDEPILSDPLQPADPGDKNTSDEDKNKPSDDDIGEVLPDHWSGAVPIFKPTMHQFRDFKRFMEAVDSYGMKSGIIKIIPPQEWKDDLPKLDDLVKQVKVREPIKQDIMGSNGTYRQVNIVHGRSYNLPQWRQLCDQSEHQPPARRGERRANAEKPKPRTRTAAPAPKPVDPSVPKKRGRGRPAKRGGRGRRANPEPAEDAEDRPMTPVSPKLDAAEVEDKPVESVEQDPGEEVEEDYEPKVGRMGVSRPARTKTQTVSARRKYSRREGSAMIDEAAFKDWDYKMDTSEYTPERCEELERAYWKTLTYAPPLYGADLMGTLFDESTEEWNLNKLPNLLDVLGTKVPGVNTAYLYLGMWKATFAWHLEDVDLYSINYLHFGAPKQWYSISQADARRFEAAMKNIWPTDAKACDQFLRHKGFLISPQHLKSHYNITVNKVVSYPGEFVVTYPYGYHSGYNLGYNCAEAVNFALDSWLEIGKIAKKCDCAQAQDSVWVNVYEIERKLRGEETEYEETEEEEDEEDDDDDEQSGMPTPPSTSGVKFKESRRKRKRGPGDKSGKVKVKKIRLRLKTKAEPPCCLCPNDTPSAELLPTDDGRKAHRLCAHYLPETYIETIDNQETVVNISEIHKDRLDLKCLYCRSKRGACFQCSQKKCARAYHATCAAAAGVFVEEEEVPVFGEDGTEYKEQAFEFSCRFHRTKRDKKLDGELLETDTRIQTAASKLQPGETCQFQYHKGDIFAGVVIENRADEQTLLVDILPNGDRLEVQWKWLLVPDPADYRLPKASANAIPMPASQKDKEKLKTKRLHDGKPQKDDLFVEGYTWAEFQLHSVSNKEQVNIDFSKPNQIWHYLPKTSTDARAQFTEDPAKQRHNPQGNFLSTVPKPVKPARPPKPVPAHAQQRPYQTMTPYNAGRLERPYVYKPRIPAGNNLPTMGSFTTQRFAPAAPLPVPDQHHPAQYPSYAQPAPAGHQSPHPSYAAQRFEVRSSPACTPPGSTPRVRGPMNAPVHSQHTQWPGVTNVSHPPPTHAPVVGATHPHHGAHQGPYQAPAPYQQAHPAQQQNHQMKASWQVHQSIYQKYPFFQVNYNRDSSKYRTPYAAWGGFTNGYEGNLRAHIMANPDAFLRSQPGSRNYDTHSSPYQRMSAVPPPASSPSQMPPNGHDFRQQSFPKGVPVPSPTMTSTTSGQFPRPALKAQYLQPIQVQGQGQAHSQQHQQSQQPQPNPQRLQKPQETAQTPNQNSKLKTATVFKPYKIPPKESPVPLPANFLAAMTSTPNTAAATAGQPALQQPSNKGSPVEPKPARKVQATQQPPSEVHTPGRQPLGAKISKTPVPIPRLPGFMPVSTSREQAALTQKHVPNQEQSNCRLPSYQGSPVTPVATQEQTASSVRDGKLVLTNTNQENAPQTVLAEQAIPWDQQDFPDVPGSESMKFMDSLLENIRTIARRDEKP
ncbi:DNA damage-responsive transcriptional repressor rph1 [Fusarium sporotrichioides]|uniref:[histone H3]-trimethyl-L-lysine(9) demethylase n=1 Tax=Fusarium sporotrichioides TaxID=5514 RepID=A0A395SI02_FUSSP|nr:DNA damage-responsive transcriptional repressor rph1 [Fusarium sporotrichioides]